MRAYFKISGFSTAMSYFLLGILVLACLAECKVTEGLESDSDHGQDKSSSTLSLNPFSLIIKQPKESIWAKHLEKQKKTQVHDSDTETNYESKYDSTNESDVPDLSSEKYFLHI